MTTSATPQQQETSRQRCNRRCHDRRQREEPFCQRELTVIVDVGNCCSVSRQGGRVHDCAARVQQQRSGNTCGVFTHSCHGCAALLSQTYCAIEYRTGGAVLGQGKQPWWLSPWWLSVARRSVSVRSLLVLLPLAPARRRFVDRMGYQDSLVCVMHFSLLFRLLPCLSSRSQPSHNHR
ncbi:hypothetical protein CCHOA_11600 [Corynebacterium choanae]|uniref:Uncharacterized protein n=1 Tax=Corynebacterium choanae TaxID=1862358 RepID=A0A3G6J993_9CORY|nr:hypothetical protein CCHOA_11600 [Corynebacterium choanae]